MDNLFELPPLPAPFGEFDVDGNTGKWIEAKRGQHLFDADQMRAYARAAVEAEREACAKFFNLNDTNLFWGSQVAQHIRTRGKP